MADIHVIILSFVSVTISPSPPPQIQDDKTCSHMLHKVLNLRLERRANERTMIIQQLFMIGKKPNVVDHLHRYIFGRGVKNTITPQKT